MNECFPQRSLPNFLWEADTIVTYAQRQIVGLVIQSHSYISTISSFERVLRRINEKLVDNEANSYGPVVLHFDGRTFAN